MFTRLLTKLCGSDIYQTIQHGPRQELSRTLSGKAENINKATATVRLFPLLLKKNVTATTNNLQISISKIDPDLKGTKYKAPSYSEQMNLNFVFGFPSLINPAVKDPMIVPTGIISDPTMDQKPEIQAHKKDKYWRRRGMKNHR